MGPVDNQGNNPVGWLAFATEDNDAAQKLFKLVRIAIEVTSEIKGVKLCTKLVKKLKVAEHFCDFVALFTVSSGVIYPDGKGEYIWSNQSTTRKVEKLSLFVLKAITCSTDEKFGFVEMGFLAKKIGEFTVLSIVTQSLILINSVASLINTKQDKASLRARNNKNEAKITKLDNLIKLFAYPNNHAQHLPVGDQIASLRLHYQNRVLRLQQIQNPTAVDNAKLEKAQNRLHALILGQDHLDEIYQQFQGPEAAPQAEPPAHPAWIDKKNIKYLKIQYNNNIAKNDLWWKDVNNIAKIVNVVVTNLLKYLAISAVVPILIMKGIVDAIGFRKSLYLHCNPYVSLLPNVPAAA